MKIKIDLAAFKALTQEQVEVLTEAQWEARPSLRRVERIGSSVLLSDRYYNGITVTSQGLEAFLNGNSVPIKWSTIEKLAEYNVITFEP